MKLLKKNIFGGDPLQQSNIIQNKQIQTFYAILILGYFGIKIVYGAFFNFYPNKYYNRNIQVTSNDENNSTTENITLNAYIPGIWNNEMSDFITMLVLGIVIYIFTNVSGKSIINQYGNLNIAFIFGYIIGLGYPALYTNYIDYFNKTTNIKAIKYIYLVLIISFAIYIITANFIYSGQTTPHKIGYIIYCIVFALLIYGLYITRKQSNNYSVVSYFNNNGDNCSFAKNGVLRTSGDVLNITLPFLAFILILLYSYEPSEIKMKYVYIFSYGILLGIIVSGISYYGMEYFLEKQPEKECNSIHECLIKQMPEPVINDIDLPNLPDFNKIDGEDFHLPNFPNINLPKNLDANLKSNVGFLNKNKISIFNLILLIFLILVAIYLIYYNLTRI